MTWKLDIARLRLLKHLYVNTKCDHILTVSKSSMSGASTEEYSGILYDSSSSDDSRDLSVNELMARTALERQNAFMNEVTDSQKNGN